MVEDYFLCGGGQRTYWHGGKLPALLLLSPPPLCIMFPLWKYQEPLIFSPLPFHSSIYVIIDRWGGLAMGGKDLLMWWGSKDLLPWMAPSPTSPFTPPHFFNGFLCKFPLQNIGMGDTCLATSAT